MNLPLPVAMLLSAGAAPDEGGYEVFLNRTGINSIDVPREKVLAEPGTGLILKFLNRGAPIHITVTSSNASNYTEFFHENLYIVDEAVLSIPIRKDSPDGAFDLEILAGLGAVKAAIPVSVLALQRMRPRVQEEYPMQPVCPWPASPADADHGTRADPVLRLALHRYRAAQYCIIHCPDCWCTLYMVPPAIVLSITVLLAALLVDRLFGDPHSAYHPVALLGRFIGWWGRPAIYPPAVQRAVGVVLWLATVGLFSLPFLLVTLTAPWYLYLLVAPFLLKICFAWKALEEHTFAVVAALKDGVEEGREKVKLLVSRNTAGLGRQHILSAGYESLTENITDSIVSPLLFFSVLGLGGAAVYRAANTMDAMLGYRDERERIGWCAARMDDLFNYVPARITCLLLLVYFASRGRLSSGSTGDASGPEKPPRFQWRDRYGSHGRRDRHTVCKARRVHDWRSRAGAGRGRAGDHPGSACGDPHGGNTCRLCTVFIGCADQ